MRVPAAALALATAALALSAPAPAPPQNCYVHIPFCTQRCYYCDFPIRIVGRGEESRVLQSERYAELLQREIAATARSLANDVAAAPLRTLYFGGGTPSLMEPAHLHSVVAALDAAGWAVDAGGATEFTMEMDPSTFDAPRLDGFVSAGVNRVSLGVQSFNDEILVGAGRAHRSADVDEALALLGNAGVGDVSVDLISGMPGQTPASWEQDLGQLAELVRGGAVAHASVYDLQLEPGTAFGRQGLSAGDGVLPAEADAAGMYRAAHAALEAAGMEHYEVSNYALPGRRSRHNFSYWRRAPFLGFGMGASSFLDGRRFSRPRTLSGYKLWVEVLEGEGLEAATSVEADGGGQTDEAAPGSVDALCEDVMLALRTADGLSLNETQARYGAAAVECVRAAAAGAEHVAVDDGDRLRLEAPEGFLVSNDIISTIFAALEEEDWGGQDAKR